MSRPLLLHAAIAAACLSSVGCSTLPRERGYAQVDDLVETRLAIAPDAASRLALTQASDDVSDASAAPLSADDAVRIAFAHSPRVLAAYARIGLGRAGVEEARRLANPRFGWSRMGSADGGSPEIARSVSLGIGNLLTLSSRRRLADGELERVQHAVADELLALAADVEAAWYASVGADQVRAMRDLVADAADTSAELAQRMFDAGTIGALQLEQELAVASQSRIDAAHAQAAALRARGELATLIGLPFAGSWQTQSRLPAPPATAFDADALTALALERRLDLAAARRDVALREDTLGVTRRWRWFGDVELGYEREREGEAVRRGPSLSLGLPLFDQGQGAIARADAGLLDARATLDAQLLDVQNSVRHGIDQVVLARDIAERYRTVLVPRREAIVARTQEHVNFMLRGVFELIAAKQAEYDAYQAYLEAVRDYWVARAALRRAVGGALPDDAVVLEPTLGVDAFAPSAEASMHGHDHSSGQQDPHAGHKMPANVDDPHAGHGTPATDADPHAGQAMPATEDDPHAGHAMPAEDADPHAGHAMPAKDVDPHAGHTMPAKDAEPASDDAHHHEHVE